MSLSLAPQTADIRLAPKAPKVLPREANPWWWHPAQAGVTGGPTDFEAKLASVDPDLAITWNAYARWYTIWLKRPQGHYGWTLLFHIKSRRPDERDLARLYASSARRWGSGKQYFDALEREYWRDKAKRDAANKADVMDHAMPQFEFLQPKVGYGPKKASLR